MARLREEYRSAGNVQFFDQVKKMLMDEPDRPSQAQVASEFDMTENAVKQAFYRFRQRYQALLREEIARTVAMSGVIEDELHHLIAGRGVTSDRIFRSKREGARGRHQK